MTQEQKRIKIAEACGWTAISNYGDGIIKGFPKGLPTPYNTHRSTVPNYFSDLNAMHEVERLVTNNIRYCRALLEVVLPETKGIIVGLNAGYGMSLLHATAAQRAEAFGIILGLWKEGE